jgi:hypothetical protein
VTRCITIAIAVAVLAGTAHWPVRAEEFTGPFQSWADLKRDYSAVGDGRADDTAAMQRALDDLTQHEKTCVLYVPAGTYRITRTVKTARKVHHDGMGITVVGEDPTRTIFRWDGAPKATMVHYDAWYSRIARLTLDGAGTAAIALNYGPAFSTYNETADMVFRDVESGLVMGGPGQAGQAENAVLRCHFLRCSRAGLLTADFNSMDIWAWDCTFENCGYGMYNQAGNFHAYRNTFLRSKQADIGSANLMVFSFVDNTSIGSACFLDFRGGHTWGSPCSITGNRIIDPTGEAAIRLGNGGPYLVMDNTIRTRSDRDQPVVEMTWGDQTFIGNTYTVPLAKAVKTAGRFRRIGERVVDPSAIEPTPPRLTATPRRGQGPVLEVPAGGGAGAIQRAIDATVRLRGRRPVVHLPKATYRIDRTLTIPAGVDLQLVGDGAAETATVLEWTGPAGGTLLVLEGPGRATVRDLALQAGDGIGLRVENCDQPGGLVLGDQLNVAGLGPGQKCAAGLRVDGVENADVFLRCLQGGSSAENWIEVLGGPAQQAGRDAPGQVALFNGATGTADSQYAVARGGRLVVRSVYHELDADSPQGILLNDSGTLIVDATRFSYKTSPVRPLIKVDGHQGSFTLLGSLLLPVNSPHPARIDIRGDGSRCAVLCMDTLF